MDSAMLLPIGVVARRTGLTVKTIRFYADRGVVPMTGRDKAGHRLYDEAAVAGLELVRTLRDLDIDLSTIKRVLGSELSLAEVAAAQAEAIAVQIQLLRRRQALLTVMAAQVSTEQELDVMHRASSLSQYERAQLIDGFIVSVFGERRGEPDFAGIIRSLRPELPDTPTPAQLEAWVELSELLQDNDFCGIVRRLADQYAAGRASSGGGAPRPDLAVVIRHDVDAAIASGVDPASGRAEPVLASIFSKFRPDRPALGGADRQLLNWLATVNDPRREQYLRLLSVINEWPPPEGLAPVFDWTTAALRARLAG